MANPLNRRGLRKTTVDGSFQPFNYAFDDANGEVCCAGDTLSDLCPSCRRKATTTAMMGHAPQDDVTTRGVDPFAKPAPFAKPVNQLGQDLWSLDEGGMKRAASADVNERNAERRITRVQQGMPDDPYDAAHDAAPYKPDIRDSAAADGDGYLLALMQRGDTPGIQRACTDLLKSRHLPAPQPRQARITAAQRQELASIDGYAQALNIPDGDWTINRRESRR